MRRNERFTTHGFKGQPVYNTWCMMLARCRNKNSPSYKYYGGRGIRVCDEWMTDAGAFIRYITKLPHYKEKNYTLDRIDNDGNYEPGNVRWATKSEQCINRRPLPNKFGLTGVTKKNKKYQATCGDETHKQVYLGVFDTPELAGRAVAKYKQTLKTKSNEQKEHSQRD